jgi:predicted nucleic acid-binding protein
VKWLVDANVLSEPTRPSPSATVLAWLRANERELVVDPIVLGELRFGILRLRRGQRRTRLEAWFDRGASRMRCLQWDTECGLRWARLLADLRTAGTPVPIKDSLVATTALVHGLTVATRNRRDFEAAGVPVVDPFTA